MTRVSKLAVFSHKLCWPSPASPSGYATDGGFPFQMRAWSELFDQTTLVVPCSQMPAGVGLMPLVGHNLRVAPLSAPRFAELKHKLFFPFWLLRNLPVLAREFVRADAVHAPIPGDVGTIGMVWALLFRKPLIVRHCGNWLAPRTAAERFWKWFMETFAGGRNVMLATGGAAEPPSRKNPNIRWIFSTSLTESELSAGARWRQLRPDGRVRLIIVGRQNPLKGTATMLESLPLIVRQHPRVEFDVVGDGKALPDFQRLAADLQIGERVRFHGKVDRDAVLKLLNGADLFCFPTTSSEGFPKAVLEALACGLPVVTTRVSVLPHLLASGCGILLDTASPSAVANAVCACLNDPARYEMMSAKALETARQFSLERWRDTIGASLQEAWGPLGHGEKLLRA